MRKWVALGALAALLLGVMALAGGTAPAGQAIQVEARVKPLLTVDGLQFRDLNASGGLDPYEDWRLATEARIDDLLSRMTLEEKVGLLFHVNTGGNFTPEYPYTEATLASSRNFIDVMYINHILDNNNGTPDYLANFHNAIQQIAEESRLGIPVTFSSDRASNTWGGMIDLPNEAFGTARDFANAQALLAAYAKEMKAIGYHVTLQPQAVEVFQPSFGEDSNYVSEKVTQYVTAYVSNGVQICLKHFPTNGYAAARSPAELLVNYMQSWAAGFEAGADWIMLTNSHGISYSDTQAHYDQATLSYLRENLGFDGVALTDWFPIGFGMMAATGTTPDGIDIASLSYEEKYARMLDLGVDQFGGETAIWGLEIPSDSRPTNLPQAILDAVAHGRVTVARIEESDRRILRTKFDLGLFDDPYVDPQAALQIAASAAYVANPWEISDTATLSAARNPRTLQLDHELQAAATILLTNNGILPLADGVRVYISAATPEIVAREAAAISKYAVVVDDPAQADVAIVRLSLSGSFDFATFSFKPGGIHDSEKAIISVSTDERVPTIVAFDVQDAVDLSWLTEHEGVAAILMMTYTVGSDHGSAAGGTFLGNTTPEILADMLFGRAEPSGSLPYELPRNEAQLGEDWGDVPFDLGATTSERLQIAAAIQAGLPAPINLGDPLFMYSYGLRYGLEPDFAYSMLTVPSTVTPGTPIPVSCIITNRGFDGYTMAGLYVDGQLMASKFMSVVSGESREVDFGVVLNFSEPGQHVVSVGSCEAQLNVAAPTAAPTGGPGPFGG